MIEPSLEDNYRVRVFVSIHETFSYVLRLVIVPGAIRAPKHSENN